LFSGGAYSAGELTAVSQTILLVESGLAVPSPRTLSPTIGPWGLGRQNSLDPLLLFDNLHAAHTTANKTKLKVTNTNSIRKLKVEESGK